jgi:hypothetical protein
MNDMNVHENTFLTSRKSQRKGGEVVEVVHVQAGHHGGEWQVAHGAASQRRLASARVPRSARPVPS